MNSNIITHTKALQAYYRWHAHIYDATRWSFLFGRNQIIKSLPKLPENPQILEIGCGTGHNIKRLENVFPRAAITGIDVSSTMLKLASKKVRAQTKLINNRYEVSRAADHSYDLILLSYSLTMMETTLHKIIPKLRDNLTNDGVIAIVDFHKTPANWFHRWMQRNHVSMNTRMLPVLKNHFQPLLCSTHNAYFGLWSYFLFIGRR